MPNSEELLQSISGEVQQLSETAQAKFGEIQQRMLLLEQKSDSYKFNGGGKPYV